MKEAPALAPYQVSWQAIQQCRCWCWWWWLGFSQELSCLFWNVEALIHHLSTLIGHLKQRSRQQAVLVSTLQMRKPECTETKSHAQGPALTGGGIGIFIVFSAILGPVCGVYYTAELSQQKCFERQGSEIRNQGAVILHLPRSVMLWR